jgi:hypothetical protein
VFRLDKPSFAALPFFIGCLWVNQTVYFLARHFKCFRGPLGAGASPLGARRVQRCDDRLALGADDVCGILFVLIVGFEHVEDQRLDVVAGGAPYAREMVQPNDRIARRGLLG